MNRVNAALDTIQIDPQARLKIRNTLQNRDAQPSKQWKRYSWRYLAAVLAACLLLAAVILVVSRNSAYPDTIQTPAGQPTQMPSNEHMGESDQTYSIKPGLYVKEGTPFVEYAWILLKENQQYEFNRHFATSYQPTGTYAVEGNLLILYDWEEPAFLFEIQGDTLVFIGDHSEMALTEIGEVFRLRKEPFSEDKPPDAVGRIDALEDFNFILRWGQEILLIPFRERIQRVRWNGRGATIERFIQLHHPFS